MLLELPAGVVEEDEQPDAAAHREIREETGMAAAELKFLVTFFLAPGYSTELMHVYLATGLSAGALTGDEDEYLSVERIPVREVYAMAESGGFHDAKTLGALMLARQTLLSA
jgi:ADP-ribose pyrophosphatase